MPQLVELSTKTSNKTKSKIKPTKNFLMQTLKELSPKKAIDFLKSLNLDKKEIKDIISKLPKNEQSKYLNILEKEFLSKPKLEKDKKETLKTDIKNLLEELDKKDSNNNEHSHILNTLLTQNSNANPKTEEKITKIKKDILQIIKKEIDSNKTLQNLLKSQKAVTEIKNASSFKELVEIANKNGLNIEKIVTEIIKPKHQNINHKPEAKSDLPNFNYKLNLSDKKTVQPIKEKIETKTEAKTDLPDFNLTLEILKKQTKKKHTQTESEKREKSLLSDLLNGKTEKLTDKLSEKKGAKKEIKKHIDENKTDNNQININNLQSEIKNRVISAKETLRHFSANIKDAIENYRPPVSKISLELNPRELGKVDVTIIKRGDNLQVQINSNNNAINLFHTHQNELKNTLVNMGFNGVDMQFNSNQNKEQEQRQKQAQQQYAKNSEEEYDELIIEVPYHYA